MTIQYDPTEELLPVRLPDDSDHPTANVAEVTGTPIKTTSAPPAAVPNVPAMSPAAQVATLTALRDAIDERITWEKKRIAEALTGATESTPLPTPFGNLSFRPAKRPVKVDEAKLIEYVKTVAPEMITTRTVIEESIPDFFHEQLVGDIVHVGDGMFVRGSTGETIEFAYLGTETTPTVSWPATREQKIVKSVARKAVDENMERLTAPMLEVTDGRP